MKKDRIGSFSSQLIVSTIMKWGSFILFVLAIVVLAYLSFVNDFQINASIRNISTIGLVSLVLNWLIWDTYYKSNYDKVMENDIKNEEYSIHKRYYFARKGWKQKELQERIRKYNDDYREAYIQDIEDLTGRNRDDIVNEPYKGNDHKILIWRLKHRKIPTSGIRTSRELMSVLNVGSSGNSRINIKKAEHYHSAHRLGKALTAFLSAGLAASLVYDFISDGFEGALLKLLLNIVLLFCSLIFGSLCGIKGAKIKLSIAEELSELLEEWKNEAPIEVPYKSISDVKVDDNEVLEKSEKQRENIIVIE